MMILFSNACIPTADMLLQHKDFTWVADSSNRFCYFMEKSIWTQQRMDSIKLAMEGNFAVVMQKLHTDFFPFDRIKHFIVKDPSSIKILINRRESDYPLQKDTLGVQASMNLYLITTFGNNSAYSRERDLLSILIINNIGLDYCYDYFYHSIGIYVNDSWQGYDLHDLAAYFYKHSYTFYHFRGLQAIDKPAVEYPMMASLFKYATEKYGIAFVRFDCYAPFPFSIPRVAEQNRIIAEWETMLRERNEKSSSIDTIRYFRYYQ